MTVRSPTWLTTSGRARLVVRKSTFTSGRSSGITTTRATASLISTDGAAEAALPVYAAASAVRARNARMLLSRRNLVLLGRKLAADGSGHSLIRCHDGT